MQGQVHANTAPSGTHALATTATTAAQGAAASLEFVQIDRDTGQIICPMYADRQSRVISYRRGHSDGH